MPRQAKRPTAPEIRDRNTRDLLGRPGLAGLARIGGIGARRGGGQSVLTNLQPDQDPANGQGHLLVLSATGVSIASGVDYVTFDAEVYRHGFGDGISADGQAVTWPVSHAGASIQVEFAWDSYQGGGTVEIEVNGQVPAWGLVGSATAGQEGCKRRSVHIQAGSEVRIKITQTSGAPQTADVTVEFSIPDPAGAAGPVLVDWNAEGWRYLSVAYDGQPGFEVPSFDDSAWPAGQAGFGDSSNAWIIAAGVNTTWDGENDMLLRRRIVGSGLLRVECRVDDVAWVWIDGELVGGDLTEAGATFTLAPPYDDLDSVPAYRDITVPYGSTGASVVAVRARNRNTGSGQFIDLKITEAPS